jgi:hypothetical protein
VSVERVREHIAALTTPAMAGRGPGQAGFSAAARYVSEQMQRLGLEPRGDDGTYLQRVPWTRVDAVLERCHARGELGDAKVELRLGEELCGKVAFAQTARGRLVHLATASPHELRPTKAEIGGAVVLLELTGIDLDQHFAKLEGTREWVQLQDRLRDAEPAAVWFVDDARCARLRGFEGTDSPGSQAPAARAAGRLPNELYVSRAGRDRLRALGSGEVVVDLRIEVSETEAPASNVLGVLRGSDPALADEYVAIGCHLDHLGVQLGLVHPGADDDGSGTAGVLALAEAFAKREPRLKRSLLFLAFCGEERGLIGSKHFVAKPSVPLTALVAQLQLDMIGRCEDSARETAAQNLNSLHVIGTEKLSNDLHRLCMQVNKRVGQFDLEWDEEDVFFRSDHVNFARRGVPIAFFFTGFHADYHAPSDTADKLDYAKLARVVDYVGAIAVELADGAARPLVDSALWEKTRERLSGPSQPAAPVRGR